LTAYIYANIGATNKLPSTNPLHFSQKRDFGPHQDAIDIFSMTHKVLQVKCTVHLMMEDPSSTAETNLLYQKLVVGFSSLLISLLFGLLPYHLSQTSSITKEELSSSKSAESHNTHGHNEDDPTMLPSWLSLATSFGGGVFLGAALLHLLRKHRKY
jgi:hypothetical protein